MARPGPLIQRIRGLCRPLEPRPTGLAEDLTPLSGIRAVLFDVYGTLFVSESGDIGVARAVNSAAALEEALASAGIEFQPGSAGARGVECLEQTVKDIHARRRAEGTQYPEVEIRAVWQAVLSALARERLVNTAAPGALSALAVEYECRVNPVWPMPGLAETLERLRQKGLLLGLVSNAQFYTPLLFPALLGKDLRDAGLVPSLCVWSFEAQEAKPSAGLFRRALDVLQREHGITASQTLYVGNDRLNDIRPAAEAGCVTALFAGDRRSLRLREDDPRCAAVRPDVTVAALAHLPPILA